MPRRTVTIAVALFDAVVCGGIAWATIASKSDQATIGLDHAAGAAAVLVFALTGGIALVLTYLGKAPKAALIFALAFPALLITGFIAVVIAFTR